MKKLLKIFAVFFVIVAVLLIVSFLVVTNGSFQKRLVMKQLPEGSTVKTVKVGFSNLKIEGLDLKLEDGTRVQFTSLNTSFKPFAVLDQTLDLGPISLSQFRVDLPPSVVGEEGTFVKSEDLHSVEASEEGESSPVETSSDEAAKETSPGILYQLRDFEWLIKVDSIAVDGVLVDGAGSQYNIEIDADEILPGKESKITVALDLKSAQSLGAGLEKFLAKGEILFTQKEMGGFETLTVQSSVFGTDAGSTPLISLDQFLRLSIAESESAADLEVSLNIDLPRPDLFLPDVAAVGALQLDSEANLEFRGQEVIVTEADFSLLANHRKAVALDLREEVVLGGQQSFSGELARLQLFEIPWEWLAPFFPEGLSINGDSTSMLLSLIGEDDGTLVVKGSRPVELGSMTVFQDGQALLEEIKVRFDPVLKSAPDGSLDVSLSGIELSDRYGSFVSGAMEFSVESGDSSTDIFSNKTGKVHLDIGLQELFQQPVLQHSASIIGGRSELTMTIDGKRAYPIHVDVALEKLKSASEPGRTGYYKLSTQIDLKETGGLEMKLQANAGVTSTTNMEAKLKLNSEVEPFTFDLDIVSKQIVQSDFDALLAAFSSPETGTETIPEVSNEPVVENTTKVDSIVLDNRPPWADASGAASIRIDRLRLKDAPAIGDILVLLQSSEEALRVDQLRAEMEGGVGRLDGQLSVLYNEAEDLSYTMNTSIDLKNFDLSSLREIMDGDIPITGVFEGLIQADGRTATLDELIEAANVDLVLTGRDGIVTAFDLGSKPLGALAGVIAAGINDPKISALTDTISLFERIAYEDLVLKLERGNDKRIVIEQLEFVSDVLLIEGTGVIAATSFQDIIDQPMDLNLTLGGRGNLSKNLEVLGLLKAEEEVDESDFRTWSTGLNIGGTLSDPDTSALLALLQGPTSDALSRLTGGDSAVGLIESVLGVNRSRKEDSNTGEPADSGLEEPSKETRDEIDVGLDLINSFFGN